LHHCVIIIKFHQHKMPNKRCRTAQHIMMMSTLAIMNQYNDAPTPKRRRTDCMNTVEAYTHTFEELYCADALLMFNK